MNDKIEKFRSYIDDEMDTAQKSAFEEALSVQQKEELETDLLIRWILLESNQELPEGYMESLALKLESAQEPQNVRKQEHSLGSVLDKCRELATEFFQTFKKPRYAMGLASLVIVIAIATNMNGSFFGENSFYRRVSGEMEMQRNNFAPAEHTEKVFMDLKSEEASPEMMTNGVSDGMASHEIATEQKSTERSLSKAANLQTKIQSDSGNDRNVKEEFEKNKGKKIIYSASVEIETEHYDEFERNFERILSDFEGFVDSRNVRSYKVEEDGIDKIYKHAEIVIRVKSDKFFEVLDGFHAASDVVNENISSEDITLVYRDTATKKKNLESREAALLKLMEKAQTMEEIIQVDREISAVREQIEAYGDRLIEWDDQVDYSTIRLYVTEVEQKKPRIKPVAKNFGEKMADTFVVSVNNLIYFAQNIVLFVIYNFLNLLLIVAALSLIVVVIRRRRKKKH